MSETVSVESVIKKHFTHFGFDNTNLEIARTLSDLTGNTITPQDIDRVRSTLTGKPLVNTDVANGSIMLQKLNEAIAVFGSLDELEKAIAYYKKHRK